MSSSSSFIKKPNKLFQISLQRPILISLVLFLIAAALRIVDIFGFRLDELLGEIILSKSLGLLLVIAYVWMAGRKLSDIGFHKRELGKSLLLGGLTVAGFLRLVMEFNWLRWL